MRGWPCSLLVVGPQLRVRKARCVTRRDAPPRPSRPCAGGAVAIPFNASTFNVLNFGAVGDGVADDTAALRAAVDAARLAGGGTVYMPPGTYLLTSTLTINSSYVVLRGAGVDATKISIPRSLGDVFPGTYTVDSSGVQRVIEPTATERTRSFCEAPIPTAALPPPPPQAQSPPHGPSLARS